MDMTQTIDPTLLPFFRPRGIVLVGASADPAKLGFGVARNLLQSDYQGAVHFVNPKGGTLLERPLHPHISAVPDPVDLAVLLVPAASVPQVLLECGRRGIGGVIIAAGGFRETGQSGASLEDECLRIARDHGMRLMGPNCIGLLDTHLPMDTTFLPQPGPTPGAVAFISHSGAICAAVVDWARGQGFGLSQLVSLGNQLDVRETDVLPAIAADPYTRVITMYLEGISDGRRFLHVARRVTRQKPVIALKVGRFAGGQQAVASHTGALAGADAAFDAAFRQAGIIRATTSEELFDWARALAWCPLPHGPRVAVLTNAGGPGVTAVDAIEAAGLEMAHLQAETEAGLRRILPPAASVANPVDMLAAAAPDQYAASLRLLLADPGVDSVMVILPPPPMFSAGGVAKAMIPIIYTAQKPVIVALMGERLIQEAMEHFRAARVPEYRFPERAAAALAILTQRTAYLGAEPAEAVPVAGVQTAAAHQVLAHAAGEGWLAPTAVADLLAAYHIPTPAVKLAADAETAVAQARAIGFPVALKLAAAGIVHKSDVGGVRLGLADGAAVQAAFSDMLARVRQAQPRAEIAGAYVQQMVPAGQEVIVGVVRDPQFGPMVMFGSGGTEVEGLEDVAFALAPLTAADVEYLLAQTWAGRKLDGFRHLPPADKAAVRDVIFRLGQLAADFPQVAEMEINPLVVLPAGQGAWAVDGRVRLGPGGG